MKDSVKIPPRGTVIVVKDTSIKMNAIKSLESLGYIVVPVMLGGQFKQIIDNSPWPLRERKWK